MAGTLRDEIKRDLGKRLKFEKLRVQSELPCEKDYYKFRRYLYKGGICGTNVKYAKMKLYDCGCADLESDYPAQIMHRRFPDGRIVKIDPAGFMQDRNKPYIARIRYRNVKSTTEHAVISSYKCENVDDLNGGNSIIDNGRIYQADEIVVYLNDIEYADFDKCYTHDTPEILDVWEFERYKYAPMHLQNITTKYYGLKTRLKRSGKQNTTDYTIAKRRANSIYGMCATSIFPTEKKVNKNGNIVDFPDCPIYKSARYKGKGKSRRVRSREEINTMILNALWRKTYKQAIGSMFLSPFIAIWVSAYARSILIDFITKYPDAVIQYDTDSLYYRKHSPQCTALIQAMRKYNARIREINARLFNNDDLYCNLGTWDIDDNIKIFKGLGAKRYIYAYRDKSDCDKIKQVVAGCRKGSMCKQVRYNNRMHHAHTDIFDFMDDNMYIDPQHSGKLYPEYVDEPHVLFYDFGDGEDELIECRSAIVLHETDFTMRLMPYYLNHIYRMKTIEREEKNGWRKSRSHT